MPKKYTKKHSKKYSKKRSRTYYKKSRNKCHSRKKFYGGNNNQNKKNNKNNVRIERGETTNSIDGIPVISRKNVVVTSSDEFVGSGEEFIEHNLYRNFQGPE